MNRPVVVMPDAVAVVTGYLRTELVNADQPMPVVSRIPSPRPPAFVRVERVGGVQRTAVTDQARLDVHAWAESEAAAYDLVAAVRALLGAMPGRHGDVTVYGVVEVGGPQWLPDPESSHPRYALAVDVHLRGTTNNPPLTGSVIV